MAQKPLEPDSPGGRAPLLAGRITRDQHKRVLSAIGQRDDLTLAEFLRDATEHELSRIEAEISDACAPP